MKKAIAKIKLAPGNVSWYDSLNNIYLTKYIDNTNHF